MGGVGWGRADRGGAVWSAGQRTGVECGGLVPSFTRVIYPSGANPTWPATSYTCPDVCPQRRTSVQGGWNFGAVPPRTPGQLAPFRGRATPINGGRTPTSPGTAYAL